MEKAKLLSIPSGETKTSFIKSRLFNLKDLHSEFQFLVKDAKRFDKETELRILAVSKALEVVIQRLTESKKKD